MTQRYYTKVEPANPKELLFTSEMRRATRKIHSVSDALVNSKLVLALSDASVWADALLIFYEIFKYLENTQSELEMPEMKALFVDDVLFRTSACKSDLDHYLGLGWEKSYTKRKAVKEYLDHLQELKEERPLLLCAYVYHLYMGLLSGGQIIKAKSQFRSLSLPLLFRSSSDTNYIDKVLDFNGADISKLKNGIKDAMNNIAAEWTAEQKCAFINESQMVFFYNNSVVKTVRGTIKAVIWKGFYILLFVTSTIIIYQYFL